MAAGVHWSCVGFTKSRKQTNGDRCWCSVTLFVVVDYLKICSSSTLRTQTLRRKPYWSSWYLLLIRANQQASYMYVVISGICWMMRDNWWWQIATISSPHPAVSSVHRKQLELWNKQVDQRNVVEILNRSLESEWGKDLRILNSY